MAESQVRVFQALCQFSPVPRSDGAEGEAADIGRPAPPDRGFKWLRINGMRSQFSILSAVERG